MSGAADLLAGVADAPVAPQSPAAALGLPEGTDWSPDAQRSYVESQVKAGTLTQAEASEQLARLDPTEAELDEAFPRARPDEYRLPPLHRPNDPITPELIQFNQDVRTWLSDAGFPKEVGGALVHEIASVNSRFITQAGAPEGFERLPPVQQQLYAREQRAVLHRMWGSEKAEQRIALAAQLIDEADERSNGKVADYLISTGAIYSANVLAQIAMHAERLQARAKARTKQ